MRILFLTDNFPPEVNAPATRTFEHARAWVEAGAAVSVITCAPNFPQGRAYAGYRNAPWQTETIAGIRVVRVWSFMARNAGFARRLIDYTSYAAAAFVAGLFEAADVIVATSPQFFTTWAGCGLSAVRGKPWVFELRDLWPESAFALGMAGPAPLMRAMERVELALYRNAARVIALTPAFKARLMERGIDAGKIVVIPNGVDRAAFAPQANPALKAGLGAHGRFLIAYIGTHGLAHGLAPLIEAMADLPEAHLLLIGDGAAKAALAASARSRALPNVTLRPQVPRAEVRALIAGADAMLVPLRRADVFRTVIPSKIFEAAAMEKPILLGVEGQAREIVERYGAGLAFVPEDAAAFRAAARRLIADPALARSLGQGGAALAAAYNRPMLAAQMLDVLHGVVRDARCST